MTKGPVGGPRPFAECKLRLRHQSSRNYTQQEALKIENKIREEQGTRVNVYVREDNFGDPTLLYIDLEVETTLLGTIIITVEKVEEIIGKDIHRADIDVTTQ